MTAVILPLFAVAVGLIGSAGPARADGCYSSTFTYAMASIQTSSSTYHGCGGGPTALAFTWTGLDGRITTPSAMPSHPSGTGWHHSGYLNMQLSFPGVDCSQGSWIQTGFYTGHVSTLSRTSNYGILAEGRNPDDCTYYINDFSALGFGGNSTYRVELDTTTMC